MPGDLALLGRVATGFVLAFVVGFERELRGSPAGDRTFALVGTGTTALTAVVLKTSPQAVAGAITVSASSARAWCSTAKASWSAA